MTEHQSLSLLENEPGDKVRLRSGDHAGQRGIITAITDSQFTVLIGPNTTVNIAQSAVTNYSLAARRAWEKMPKRAGRPKSDTSRKRMVSIRIDSSVWDRLGQAVDQGLIVSREQAVNEWLRERLNNLLQDN